MPALLDEIAWSDPVLPPVSDPAWEAEVKRATGSVSEVQRRIAPSPWLRTACLRVSGFRVTHMPADLIDLGVLVTSQENACRYCYGATRAYMRILGYPERKIVAIERQAQLAELDPKERAFLQFCRNLARSKPRPAKAELESLVALGYSPLAAKEMAFFIAFGCFYNRVTALLACPPEAAFERFSESILGRLMALAGPWLLRPRANRKRTARGEAATNGTLPEDAAFRFLAEALDGLPAAYLLCETLEAAMASPVLPRRTKLLMFAVVAKALDCAHCQIESRALLADEGLDAGEVDACVAALGSPSLEPYESSILRWVRGTVHFEPRVIQQRTHELKQELGEAELLEAVGIAALANATVRLGMLLE